MLSSYLFQFLNKAKMLLLPLLILLIDRVEYLKLCVVLQLKVFGFPSDGDKAWFLYGTSLKKLSELSHCLCHVILSVIKEVFFP